MFRHEGVKNSTTTSISDCPTSAAAAAAAAAAAVRSQHSSWSVSSSHHHHRPAVSDVTVTSSNFDAAHNGYDDDTAAVTSRGHVTAVGSGNCAGRKTSIPTTTRNTAAVPLTTEL